MPIQALIFGLLLGGGGVLAWDSATSKSAVGVPHASGAPDKDGDAAEHCCLIPANRGLYRTEP